MSIPPLPGGVPALPSGAPPLPTARVATLDFETYSEAGYIWNEGKKKWDGPPGSREKGLFAVGSRKYAEHPTAEILTASYRLPDGTKRRWKPGVPGAQVVNRHHGVGYDLYVGRGTKWGNHFGTEPGPGVLSVVGSRSEAVAAYRRHVLATPALFWAIPELVGKTLACSCCPQECHADVLAELAGLPWDLLLHLRSGGLVEAHNAMFERNMWTFVGVRRYGFPQIHPRQWRCSMAKGRASGFPGSLAQLGAAMRLAVQKDTRGKELINLFCVPRKPTKLDPSKRILPTDDPDAFEGLQAYCDTDRDTEHEASGRIPDLIPSEQEYWFADQAVNFRGLGVDLPHVECCALIVGQVIGQFSAECEQITGGIRPSQVQAIVDWCADMGVRLESLDMDSLDLALKRVDLPPAVRRVLEIRQLTGSASVKKVFAMRSFCSDSARLHDLFIFHGARTGRDTHADVQPGNLPKAGPKVWHCLAPLCNRWYGAHSPICPWCGSAQREGEGAGSGRPGKLDKPEAWGYHAVGDALEAIRSANASVVQWVFGDALLAVSGVVRSLICAADGHDLICSDYSSIEAVVIAELAGEQWRIDAFHSGQDIYYHGASSVTGKTYQWYKDWEKENGQKHPDRQKLGKPAELGLGFGGWIGAWLAFGGEGTEDEIREVINKWRAASPMIVELWGGQFRGTPWNPTAREFFGLEGMSIQAVLNPGQRFTHRLISFEYAKGADVLYMHLPSGRTIKYREPRLTYGAKRDGWVEVYELTFMTQNTNPKMGPLGWVRMPTYGGRLAENATQAVARDIMANAVVKLEAAHYPVVLRIHDELASEVPHGFGSVAEYERIMCDVPAWAVGWPIRADGGWRGKRYRKG